MSGDGGWGAWFRSILTWFLLLSVLAFIGWVYAYKQEWYSHVKRVEAGTHQAQQDFKNNVDLPDMPGIPSIPKFGKKKQKSNKSDTTQTKPKGVTQ